MDHPLPTRIRWTVDFRNRATRSKRIARHIREAAPQVVELRIDGDRGFAELPPIFLELHKCDARIEATLPLSPKTASALRWGYPIDFIWALGGDGGLSAGAVPQEATAVSFTPDRENIDLLPDVLKDFCEGATEELRLPHIDSVRAIAKDGHVPVTTAGQIRRVSEKIARAGLSFCEKRLVVADYLLWRTMRDAVPEEAGERIEFPGCQAGTFLAYVDWDGNVYPCDSLPVRLGNLLETPLERIWRSPARRSVADAIRRAPGDCEACAVYSGCFGGCRGLAYLANASFPELDPGPAEEI